GRGAAFRSTWNGTDQCFNGATAMKPWRRRIPSASSLPPPLLQWGHGDEAVEEGPPPRTVWSKGLRSGFARGSTRGGVKTIASSSDEVVKSKGNGTWAQREAPARRFRANILSNRSVPSWHQLCSRQTGQLRLIRDHGLLMLGVHLKPAITYPKSPVYST